jgi:hypothetical protein
MNDVGSERRGKQNKLRHIVVKDFIQENGIMSGARGCMTILKEINRNNRQAYFL